MTEEELGRFHREGYLVVPNLFEPEEVAEMRLAFDRLLEMTEGMDGVTLHRGAQFVVESCPDRGLRVHRVVWCGAAEPTLLAWGEDPRLLSLAAQVLGTQEFDQLINQAHFKMPGDGVVFPWHQDSVHRRYGTELWDDVNGRGSFVEIVTALDRATADNGTIQFVAGSGVCGHLPHDPETKEISIEPFDASRLVTTELEAGSVVLFGPYVIHGSGANTTRHSRRFFLNGFSCPGANHREYPGEGSGRRLVAPSPD